MRSQGYPSRQLHLQRLASARLSMANTKLGCLHGVHRLIGRITTLLPVPTYVAW